jgi:hypothetical protein
MQAVYTAYGANGLAYWRQADWMGSSRMASTVGRGGYMHRNPVKRGLVEKPEDWRWSSFRHDQTGAEGAVEIESEWTGRKRERWE